MNLINEFNKGDSSMLDKPKEGIYSSSQISYLILSLIPSLLGTKEYIQNLLFVCHCDFIKMQGSPLITTSFYAFPFGPVEIEMFKKWRGIKGPITERKESSVSLPHKSFIKDILQKWESFSPNQLNHILRDSSFSYGRPWSLCYREGWGELIPNELIMKENIN